MQIRPLVDEIIYPDIRPDIRISFKIVRDRLSTTYIVSTKIQSNLSIGLDIIRSKKIIALRQADRPTDRPTDRQTE